MTKRERNLLKLYGRKIKTAIKERVSGDLGEMLIRQVDKVRIDTIDEILKKEEMK